MQQRFPVLCTLSVLLLPLLSAGAGAGIHGHPTASQDYTVDGCLHITGPSADIHNNTARIQLAIDAVSSSAHGGCVVVSGAPRQCSALRE